MTKARIRIGYRDYVLDLKDAVLLADLLSKAERFESKYRSGATNTVHIWEQDNEDDVATITVMSTTFYNMAKLAGKPEEK